MKKMLTLISLVLLALSNNAFADADNATSFHGSVCDNYYAADSGAFNHQWNGIHNASANPKWVSCPVNKDAVAITGGLGYTWVHGETPRNTRIDCYMVALGYHAEWKEFKGGSLAAGFFVAKNDWFSIPPVAFDNYWGSNQMHCLLPAGATLHNFVIHEN